MIHYRENNVPYDPELPALDWDPRLSHPQPHHATIPERIMRTLEHLAFERQKAVTVSTIGALAAAALLHHRTETR